MNSDPTQHNSKLLLAVAGGDALAFAELFHAWKDKLYYYLLRIHQSSETAEDQVQDIFLKVWINRNKLSGIENFGAWLFSIARNHAISGMRRMALETTIMREIKQNTMAAGSPVDETLLFKQVREKLKTIIDALPAQQKLVYQLSRDLGLKHEEIARQLNISVSTVQNHMTLALKTIRTRLLEFYPAGFVFVLMVLTTAAFPQNI